MNYLKHRLLAGILACILLLGASPIALSAEVDTFSSGRSGGVTSNEGKKPENLINLVMPTVRDGLFDFLIDPAGMVRSTRAARYLSAWGVESVEIGDGNLFFRNISKDSDGTTAITLSNRSDPLTIINKSTTAVDVSLSFDVQKDSGLYDFTFVDNDEFLDENGDALTSLAMYLALRAGRRSGPVHEETVEEGTKYVGSIRGWLPKPDGDFLDVLWDGSKYSYRLKDDIPETAFHSMSFFMTGAINSDTVNWNGANDASLTVTWNVKKLASDAIEDPYIEDFDPLVEMRVGAKEVDDEVVMLIDYGEGRKAMTKVDSIVYTASDDSSVIFKRFTLEGSILRLTAISALMRGRDWAVRFADDEGNTFDVPFDLKKDVDPVNPTATVIAQATAVGESAVVNVNWGAGTAAMTRIDGVKYTQENGEQGTIPDNRITVEEDTVTINFTALPFAGSDFMLVFANNGGKTFELPVDLVKVVIPDREPSVTNVQKVSEAGQSAVLTVDWGYGDKAMTTVSSVKYTRASGTAGTISTSNITVDGNTVSIKVATTPFAGSDFILVFSNNSNETFEVPVELVDSASGPENPGESVDPSVTSVQKVTEAGQSATVTVNWGSGSKAMTTVSSVKYTRSSGTAGTISSSNITVSGTTVTIKVAATPFAGSDFILVFSNASNETFEVPVELVDSASGPENPGESVDPSVTSVQKVTEAGQSATVTVNWGSGSKAMTTVSSVKYTRASGTAGTISSSNITVNGTTVTIKVAATPFAGSHFILVFSNDSNETFEVPVELVDSASGPENPGESVDPSVTSVQKVTEVGQYAEVTVNWGSGDKAMTTVSSVKYTRASGTAGTISSSNITVSGTTVTIKVAATPFAGSDFILVFSDTSGETFEVPVELVDSASGPENPGESVDPSVTGVQKVTEAGQYAEVTVNWGSGDKAMTTVSSIRYTRASGTAGSISSSNITVSGTTVTIKVAATPFAGSDFILVFSDASGETFEVPVELVDSASGPENPGESVDPSVTGVQKVTEAGQYAEVTVNWGNGDKAMTTVNRVNYTRSNGVSSYISASNITVDGNKVTVKVAATPFAGSNFILVFSNASNETFELPVDLVDTNGTSNPGESANPSVTNVKKVATAGEYAEVTVDWGSGDKAMTTVNRVNYMRSNGVSSYISASNITVDGNKVTIKVAATPFAGSGFSLVFSNSSNVSFELPVDLVA